MIFVTTGTQIPFDRLIRAIDEVHPYLGDVELIVQVAESVYKAENFKIQEFIAPKEFDDYFDRAELIISHAGMGTIISAFVKNKPILVMPRLAKYGEHRNDHQLATATRFDELGYINVAYTEEELKEKLKSLQRTPLKPLFNIDDYASKELISSLQSFINLK
ncbi:glycosyltransferase [Mucilaginibacter sp. BT774]|uniref:glycosyltransferase n=1 Tax=Mucilaginibacter sp. BT774 TaxID=3062276 RepID=UPI002675CE34|nr:glycosyltransferase [Mucilaginibacter sp. BT774]MDO3628854.1 glycosyltransferase [Mucilaginibacter sp. BT774]